jgi:hypothetical protein
MIKLIHRVKELEFLNSIEPISLKNMAEGG